MNDHARFDCSLNDRGRNNSHRMNDGHGRNNGRPGLTHGCHIANNGYFMNDS